MTAKIYSFKNKEGKKPHHRKTDSPLRIKKEEPDIFKEVSDVVISAWIYNMTNGTIDSYFHSKLPDFCKDDEVIKSCHDLNLILSIEKKLNMKIASYCPQITPDNKNGWMAAFKHDRWVFRTPPDMSSEEGARALNILLFISFNEAINIQRDLN